MPFASNADVADFIDLHPLYFYLHFTQTSSQTASPATRTTVDVNGREAGYLPTPSPSPPRTPSLGHVPDPWSIISTHLPTFHESRPAQYGPLCAHPNASCAFATFPPVAQLTYESGGETVLTVENPEGCTILDVNRALAELCVQNAVHRMA